MWAVSFLVSLQRVPIQPSLMDSPILTSHIGVVLSVVCICTAQQRKTTQGVGTELLTIPNLIEPRSSVHLPGSSYSAELHFFDAELSNKFFFNWFSLGFAWTKLNP